MVQWKCIINIQCHHQTLLRNVGRYGFFNTRLIRNVSCFKSHILKNSYNACFKKKVHLSLALRLMKGSRRFLGHCIVHVLRMASEHNKHWANKKSKTGVGNVRKLVGFVWSVNKVCCDSCNQNRHENKNAGCDEKGSFNIAFDALRHRQQKERALLTSQLPWGSQSTSTVNLMDA